MTRLGTGWIAVAILYFSAGSARGQTVTGWYPIERPAYAVATANYGNYVPVPVDATYAPGPAAYAPAANMSTTVSTRWEQAAPATYAPAYAPPATYTPAMNYAPLANYSPAVNYAPMTAPYAVPTVTYMPVVAHYPAPTYVTHAPPAKTCAPPVPAGPKVWVHPKVYVEGQPIRNLIRAITP